MQVTLTLGHICFSRVRATTQKNKEFETHTIFLSFPNEPLCHCRIRFDTCAAVCVAAACSAAAHWAIPSLLHLMNCRSTARSTKANNFSQASRVLVVNARELSRQCQQHWFQTL